MLNLRKVAVTGGLAAGKSSVCHMLQQLGAFRVSSDQIAHELLSSANNLQQQIIDLLGSDIVVSHKIDRSQIAKKVFNNPQLLHSLESIMHPAIKKELDNLYQEAVSKGNFLLFVAEIPLLFELGGASWFDYDDSIAVIANIDTCKQRFLKATGYDANEYMRRSLQQLSMEEKAKKADYVIFNDSDLSDLYKQVLALFEKLKNLSQ